MSNTNPKYIAETEAFKTYLNIMMAAIKKEASKSWSSKRSTTGLELEAHINFLAKLDAIRKSLNKNPNLTDLQKKLQLYAGEYLSSLERMKPSKEEHQEIFRENLVNIKLGIGRALLKIEKIKRNTPAASSMDWFVNIFKGIYERLSGLTQAKKQTFLLSASYAKTMVLAQEDILMLQKKAELRALSSEQRLKELQKSDQNTYVEIFNRSPKEAIKLIPSEYQTPEIIANFLAKPGLDKALVADYLGAEQAKTTLDAFIQMNYDFRGISNKADGYYRGQEFVDATRKFLGTFQLPSEGQKIPRIMESFAARFHEQYPGIFANQDAAYVLAVAIVMLNTDAHNPNIPKNEKMTEAGFIKNLRGTNNGQDFPEEMLKGIYNDIKNREIKKFGEEAEPPKHKHH